MLFVYEELVLICIHKINLFLNCHVIYCLRVSSSSDYFAKSITLMQIVFWIWTDQLRWVSMKFIIFCCLDNPDYSSIILLYKLSIIFCLFMFFRRMCFIIIGVSSMARKLFHAYRETLAILLWINLGNLFILSSASTCWCLKYVK